MSDCTVWTEFDGDKRVFEPGDKIVGTVHVKIDRARSDASVCLKRQWRTSGRAPSRTGGNDKILLFEGSWDAAGTYEYPFIFHVPPGPYTYHGRLLDVDWFLCAEAHIEGAHRVSSEEKFGVEASGKEREFIVGDTSSGAGGEDGGLGGAERVLWLLGTLILLLVGTALVYPNLAALPGASWLTLFAGMGCLGLSGVSGHALMRRQREDDGDGMLEPSPDDYQVEPGDHVAFVVELRPNFKTSPRGVTAVLKGYEHVLFDGADANQAGSKQAGSKQAGSQHADVHRFYEEAIPIEPTDGAGLEHGQKSSYRVSFRMPADAPYSFYCPNASVNWAIEVHVDVGSWPDWHRDFPVVVRPCVGDGRLRQDSSVIDRGELA